MKKITVLLAMLLVLSLTACNNANENTAVTDNGGDTTVSDTVTDTTTPEAEDTTAPETEGEKTTENNGETVTEGSEDVTEPETEGTTMPETTEPEVTTTPEVPVEDEKNQATTEPDTDDSSVNAETSNDKEDTPQHTHKYSDKVVAPTCEKGGYTVHTCDCGHSYSDKETKATGHSYTEKVVAPTTSAQGYTLHTCSKCGTSYKDSYVDKLPTQTTTPSTPGDTEFEEDGWKGDDYGSGETIIGDATKAGQFVDNSKYARKFYTPGMGREEAQEAINSYAIYNFGGRHFQNSGIKRSADDEGKFAKIVQHNDGRLGVNVFGWRKSYDSSATQNININLVMEAFYFFTGDKDVAYALWSAVDYLNVAGGGSISNDKLEAMGFSLSNETARSIEMTMNGVHIYWEWPAGTNSNIFYFG